ncbi:MAG: signal peptidase I [Halanaerobiaceae bacterium]
MFDKEFFQSLLIAAVLALFIMTFVAQSFVVDGRSMDPTLIDGERLFVNKFIYRFHPPERGDIIVFSPNGSPGRKYIKRVIGLPGETVTIRNGVTYIDGNPLQEDYLDADMRGSYGPYKVPEESVFVLGDNRNHSADSRQQNSVGFVDYEQISGRAFWVYWPLTKMRIIEHHDYAELDS